MGRKSRSKNIERKISIRQYPDVEPPNKINIDKFSLYERAHGILFRGRRYPLNYDFFKDSATNDEELYDGQHLGYVRAYLKNDKDQILLWDGIGKSVISMSQERYYEKYYQRKRNSQNELR